MMHTTIYTHLSIPMSLYLYLCLCVRMRHVPLHMSLAQLNIHLHIRVCIQSLVCVCVFLSGVLRFVDILVSFAAYCNVSMCVYAYVYLYVCNGCQEFACACMRVCARAHNRV